jgi:hypothetical protein
VLCELVELVGYLEADCIAQCLYGSDRVHIAVPTDPRREPWVLGRSLGGGRVATEQHNTTLSAVGVLRRDSKMGTLTLFHNAFAALPVAPARFRFDGVRHLAWRATDPRLLPGWVEVTSTTV